MPDTAKRPLQDRALVTPRNARLHMPRCDFCGDATNVIAAWQEGLVCADCEDLACQAGWNPDVRDPGRTESS